MDIIIASYLFLSNHFTSVSLIHLSNVDFLLNLHYHLAANETSLKRPLAEDNNIERKRIARAFETEYQGTAIQTFYSRLTFFHSEWHRNEKPYVPYLTIIQNSGSGKTRLVGELSNLGIYVLYICKRHKDSSGYPALFSEYLTKFEIVNLTSFYLQLFK